VICTRTKKSINNNKMKTAQHLLTLLIGAAAPNCSLAKYGDGTDLANDAPIRIGVKHRPPECPRKSTTGDFLEVHYVGTLYSDKEQFDSSRDRDEPFVFAVGQGQVIPGWDQGMLGMCEGEKRRLTIPSDLAYGETGSPPAIKGGATLVFEVELLRILSEEEAAASGMLNDMYGGSDPFDMYDMYDFGGSFGGEGGFPGTGGDMYEDAFGLGDGDMEDWEL